MGKILDDGRRIGVINTYPRFFDISFVFIGADKTAKVMCKLASGIWVPASVAEGEALYGAENDTPSEGLVKAASTNVFYFSHDSIKEATNTMHTGAGQAAGALAEENIEWGPKPSNEPDEGVLRDLIRPGRSLVGNVDEQKSNMRRAVSDGELKTNADVNETDEFPEPLTPSRGKVTSASIKDEPAPVLNINDPLEKRVRERDAETVPAVMPGADTPAEKSKVAAGLVDLFSKARNIKIGPPPTPNRKEYPFVGTINFRGLAVHVENKPGDVREGTSPSGKKWRTHMKLPYGEFLGSLGTDGDKLDVYVGPHRKAPNVYVIHQNHARGPKKGKYDEDKVMVGFESPEQAKAAYLAHYDSPQYFRSITTMSFPLFKRLITRKEVHGEKVAAIAMEDPELVHAFFYGAPEPNPPPEELMEKVAVELEELFASAKNQEARRRQKTWRQGLDGKEVHVTGSGIMDKTAAEEDWVQREIDYVKEHGDLPDAKTRMEWKTPGQQQAYQARVRSLNAELKRKSDAARATLRAEGRPIPTIDDLFNVKREKVAFRSLEPDDLLKVSNDPKTASHLKWADIVKEIGPEKAVGKVTPLLSESEPSVPCETLSRMGEGSLEKGLATSSLMGMVLKPEEFQRSLLCSMGQRGLADKLDDENAVFKPNDEEACPCEPLSSSQFDRGMMEDLLPSLLGKSYFGPVVKRRIIRISVLPAKPAPARTEVESPLLSKVAAAYNWYRREQMKLASDSMGVIASNPQLHAGLYGLGDGDLFYKSAAGLVNPKTLAVLLGAVPLTLMYSAHLRGKQRRGEDMGTLKGLIADHPWLTTMGVAAGLRKVMETPQAQQAVDEMIAAGKRIMRGSAQAAGDMPVPEIVF
jgi:hypothetical protein